MRIATRLFGLIALAVVGILLIAGLNLSHLRTQTYEQKHAELKHLAESATAVLASYHAKAQSGELTEEDAKARALEAISGMRYNETDYFWVNDMAQRMIMHPIKPELNGKDLSELQDKSGKFLFREFVKVVEANGGGVVGYLWPKPGHEEPVAKQSFVQGFAPWGLIVGTGVYINDLEAQLFSEAMTVGGICLAILINTVVVSIFTTKSITSPLSAVTGCMRSLADGDLEVEIPARNSNDEIGAISKAVEVFKANAVEQKRMEMEHEKTRHQSEEIKRTDMNRLAAGFEESVKSIVDEVSSAIGNMQSNAQQMSSRANDASTQSSAVVSASQETTSNVQTVASASEQLSESIQEISKQVADSSKITSEAVQQVETTNGEVEGLSEAAKKIGDVIDLISDIAEQTNLLALNATIEAARAGDAGKGFAVVASEVKNLATQTAKATEEIGAQINSMQNATETAVTAIKNIGTTISRVDEIASSISAAVEEQGAATHEISRNVQEAAASTQSVSGTINKVHAASSETGQSAKSIEEATGELTRLSDSLRGEVETFLGGIRAA
ncbi:methyl-accepting chemotaxis protein [Pelagibius sp. Alg239-R121]|uniref:methyl-accepting chemotaxis protein n=1 Tax=Pelagibius sp. Alg239-R121 TaxID=2993448 RepID=UPI0024A68BB6|nr:cache domain-containing protein [Pelagibius sp. Alg239-R121]